MNELLKESASEFKEKFVVISNAGTGLLRYTDADKILAWHTKQMEKAYNKGLEVLKNKIQKMQDAPPPFNAVASNPIKHVYLNYGYVDALDDVLEELELLDKIK